MTSFGVQILKAESVNHAAGQRNIALNSEQKKQCNQDEVGNVWTVDIGSEVVEIEKESR